MVGRLGPVWCGSVVLSALVVGCGGGSGSSSGGDLAPAQATTRVSEAQALSNHYVEVGFAAAAGDDAGDPGNYVITDPDGASLAVSAVRLSDDRTQAVLTTDSQQAVQYRLTLRAPAVHTSATGNQGDTSASVVFNGSIQLEPFVASAISLNANQILLTFSATMAAASVADVRFYEIADPDLAVTAAVLQADGQRAILTTATQANVAYTVRVTNVTNKTGQLINPFLSEAEFSGIPPVDDVPPKLLSAQATSSTTVLLTFNEPLRSNDVDNAAEDASNYSLSPAVTVIAAQLNDVNTQVLLTTLPLAAGVPYTLAVDNVNDAAGNFIDPVNRSVAFTFQGQAGLDNDLPRVVGAASTGNKGVLVQFNRPMGDSATNPGAYVVVQDDVNPEVGFLTITGAAFTGPDRTAVTLTTLSQNEVTYDLTVVNVRDLIGLPMAAKQIIAGVLLDPSAASFPGTPPSCPPLSCTNGEPGIDGHGLCASDDDCTDSPPCTVGPCAGACASSCTLSDSDDDALTDNDEQRGWVVTIQLANGDTIRREVTSDPGVADTDGDGLPDALEKNIGTDPRHADTDGDQLDDNEEWNVVYTDPTNQDTDGDTIADNFEVEFYKTNALVADSDGDGYSDSQELFEMSRDPRIADLPRYEIVVGAVRLQIDERFTTTDDSGNVVTEDSSTSTSLENDTSFSSASLNQTVGNFMAEVAGDGGWDTTNGCEVALAATGNCWRAVLTATVGGGVEFTTANTTESARAAMNAFQTSLDKGREVSTDHAVTREVAGASLSAEVTLQNLSNVAFTLSNVEIRVATTDPQDPTRLVPVATLFPDSTVQTGDAADFNIGPGQTRGPVIFSNREVFPNLVEDLMRSPRGLVFTVANYDQTTEDGRNFAFGLQQVQERTAEVSFDFGDGEAKEFHAITAGVLNRPRDELRCAPAGDHPDQSCVDDADCGTSTPCEGGTVIGGFTDFGGTGRPDGTRLDFVLQDILDMRKSTPAAILAGPDLVANTQAQGDDVQVIPTGTAVATAATVVVAPGRDLVLDSAPSGDDFSGVAPRIVAGQDGVADTAASGDDVQVLPVGTTLLAAGTVVIAPGANGQLDTVSSGDDVVLGPDGILPGNDGAVQSVAQGDDVQVVPVGTTGVPEDAVVISAGRNGVLDTPLRGDDIVAVVTGYEVSKTCNASTPFAILAGPNSQSDTQAETGICTIASPPHFVGESCSRDAANPDAGCGVSDTAPTSTAAANAAAGTTSLTLADAAAFPSSGVISVGSQETRYTGKAGNVLTILALAADATAGDIVTLVTGRCTADDQVVAFGQNAGSRDAIVVSPSTAQFLASVPGGDDVYVAPGIACTEDADCSAGGSVGQCNGPQNVVRVEQRRNGQFRRFWAMLLPDNTQVQTDFGDILVRPGDAIALAFIQDIDRDGLIVPEEFLHHSSDFKKDTDDDQLGDFSEVRLGWDVGVVGQPIRRVFPDPSLRDTDGDGLTDKEEQDLRIVQCACNAIGPKSLLGSGGLLRGDAPADGAMPCHTDDDCGGVADSCVDAVHCDADGLEACPPCSSDVTRNQTDPRVRDTDEDGVSDADEIFGYLTGAGLVDPSSAAVILAGTNLRADTVACPQNYCVEDADKPAVQRQHCMTDGDCFSRNCIHPVACDEVQVVPLGAGVRDARTVVVAPGPLMGLVSMAALGDESDVLPTNGLADSRLQGDDQLVVGPGQGVRSASGCVDGGSFELCSAIKPGVNSRIDSLRRGDDVIIPGGSGQKLEVSDPLSPDTDIDLIADGIERLLGSSPNLPGDAIFGGDLDADGLTDVLEALGWTVHLTDATGAKSTRSVLSDPYLPDTDFDGLPDYAERNLACPTAPTCDTGTCSNDGDTLCSVDNPCENRCPTDPNRVDTDGDGISDFDELSAEQFADLERLNNFFPAFHIDGTGSKRYGTDPTRIDSDGDGLADRDELLVGWIVVRDDGSVERVFSDPTQVDTDADSLPDNEESTARTDPGDADTDGDGRLDGLEAKIGTNPLQPDIFVAVTYSLMQLTGPQDGGDGLNDWAWRLSVQDSNQRFPGTTLSDEQSDCPPDGELHPAACMTNRFNFFLNRSTAVALTPNNGIILNGIIVEIVSPDDDTQPIDEVRVDKCRMSFVDQPLTYDTLQGGTFMTRTFGPLSDLNRDQACSAYIVAEISVNCIGEGKGYCRVGNPCVADEDCESGSCSSCSGGNCDGVGTCQSECGNGVREFAPESLGEAQQFACLFGASLGQSFTQNCELCDDGNTDDCGTCNSTCGTVGALGEHSCPQGTPCVDDIDCNGRCDLATATCVDVCGDGRQGTTEFCDDGNTNACGPCDMTCTAAGTGAGCPDGSGCNADTVCASGKCVDGACQP